LREREYGDEGGVYSNNNKKKKCVFVSPFACCGFSVGLFVLGTYI